MEVGDREKSLNLKLRNLKERLHVESRTNTKRMKEQGRTLAETASHQGEKDGQVKSYSPAKGKPKVESTGSENPLPIDFGTYLAGPFCLLLFFLEAHRGISESLNRHLCLRPFAFTCFFSSTSLASDLLNPWMSSQPEGTGRLRSDRAGFSSRALAMWGIRTWHF